MRIAIFKNIDVEELKTATGCDVTAKGNVYDIINYTGTSEEIDEIVEQLPEQLNQDELKIIDWIGDIPEDIIKRTNFTTIGLIGAPSEYEKGRKVITRYYSDPEMTDVVVQKSFTDTFDENGNMNGISIHFEWITRGGDIGAEKTEPKPFNTVDVGSHLRKRRMRAIDYLKAGAVGTPIEPVVTLLFQTYKTEIEEFEQIGSDSFAVALQSETDETLRGYLDMVINVEGHTTMQVILGQI